MDIKIIGASPTDTEVLEEKQEQKLEGGNDGEINTIAIRQVLDVTDSAEYEGEIKTLIEWAKATTGSSDHTELKWAIRDLQMRLGTPLHGDAIKNLARFAYLDLEEKRIQKEKKSFS